MSELSESCFAKSRHLEFWYNGKLLGFVLANTVLNDFIKRFDPPEGNPIIAELLHDFKKNPVFCFDPVTDEHEKECLEYIGSHLKWDDVEWRFQARHRTCFGILKQLLKAGGVSLRFGKEQTPQFLYKYTASKNVSHFIESSSIYLSAPTKFNDPFDCPFTGPARKKMEKIGISCFSSANKNSVMFSHYADEHRGACLIFNPDHFTDLWNRWDVNVGGRIQRVIYYDRFPRFDEDLERARIATAKHRDWSYERECRLTTNWGYPSGLYKFKPEALTGIIFGVRMKKKRKSLRWLWITGGR
jgi:hypothetical protein